MGQQDAHDAELIKLLYEASWRDWENKSKHEWRLSFGIWGAMLASVTLLIKEDLRLEWWQPTIAVVIIFSVHWRFLIWIRRSLKHYRKLQSRILAKAATRLSIEMPTRDKSLSGSYTSLLTQLLITAILAALLIAVPLLKKTPSKHMHGIFHDVTLLAGVWSTPYTLADNCIFMHDGGEGDDNWA